MGKCEVCKLMNNNEIKESTKYEIVGIQEGKKPRIYKSGTIFQICKDECLDEYGFDEHKTIDDVLRDMDCFSRYKHYAKIIN